MMFLFCSVCGVFQILGKCEFLNPGGSVKDRVAVKIIEEVNICYLNFFVWCCWNDLGGKKGRYFNVGVLFIFVWVFKKL